MHYTVNYFGKFVLNTVGLRVSFTMLTSETNSGFVHDERGGEDCAVVNC
jgi:hypothetical protein